MDERADRLFLALAESALILFYVIGDAALEAADLCKAAVAGDVGGLGGPGGDRPHARDHEEEFSLIAAAFIARTVGEQLCEHGKLLPEDKSERHRRIYNHGLITAMAVVLVWLLALMIFVVIEIAWPAARLHWLAFVFAVPLSGVVWLVMNSIWFNKKRNYLIISLLMWALLAAIFVTLLNVGINVWLIFLLGVPCQLILIFGSMLKFRKK